MEQAKKCRIGKTFLAIKKVLEEITIPELKLDTRAIVLIQRQVDQWNRIEDPAINPYTYRHLIFDKKAKNIQRKSSSINAPGQNGSL